MMTTTLRTFRDAILQVAPPWLQRGTAARVLYSFGVHLDGLLDAVTAGVKMRFPNYYSAETLPIIGRERGIRRGLYETNAVYASRLTRWLDDHRRRGGPYALLAQLFAHYAPHNFPIELVYYSGRRFSMDATGAVVRDDIDWVPDANAAKWARWWLFYRWPDPIETDGLWSDPGVFDDGGVWDSNLSPDDVADLRVVPTEWNAAHAMGRVVLLSPDLLEFWDYPPGTWDESGVWGTVGDGPIEFRIE